MALNGLCPARLRMMMTTRGTWRLTGLQVLGDDDARV